MKHQNPYTSGCVRTAVEIGSFCVRPPYLADARCYIMREASIEVVPRV